MPHLVIYTNKDRNAEEVEAYIDRGDRWLLNRGGGSWEHVPKSEVEEIMDSSPAPPIPLVELQPSIWEQPGATGRLYRTDRER